MNKYNKLMALFLAGVLILLNCTSALATYNDRDNNGTIDYLYDSWYDNSTYLNDCNIGTNTVLQVSQCIDANQNDGNTGKEKIRVWANTDGVEEHFEDGSGMNWWAYARKVRAYFWCYDDDDEFEITSVWPDEEDAPSIDWDFDVRKVALSVVYNLMVKYVFSSTNVYIADNTGDGNDDYVWIEQRFPETSSARNQLNLPSGTSNSRAYKNNDTGAIYKIKYREWRPSGYEQHAGTQARIYYHACDGNLHWWVWSRKSQVNHDLVAGPH